jgi:hypothetical protein
MFFLVNENKKIIFGWSAKAGCSHVKNLFYFLQNGTIINTIHTNKDVCKLPLNLNDYIVILFIRNPYKRLVSGFLDKYKLNGELRYKWTKNISLTFINFVNELITGKYIMIDKHHFTPQLSEQFNLKIIKHSKLFIFDIEKINYEFLEKLYNIKIPDEVLNFRGDNIYKATNIVNYNMSNINIDKIIEDSLKISYDKFYTKEIKEKIYNFYKLDFVFFNAKGFNYDIEIK